MHGLLRMQATNSNSNIIRKVLVLSGCQIKSHCTTASVVSSKTVFPLRRLDKPREVVTSATASSLQKLINLLLTLLKTRWVSIHQGHWLITITKLRIYTFSQHLALRGTRTYGNWNHWMLHRSKSCQSRQCQAHIKLQWSRRGQGKRWWAYSNRLRKIPCTSQVKPMDWSLSTQWQGKALPRKYLITRKSWTKSPQNSNNSTASSKISPRWNWSKKKVKTIRMILTSKMRLKHRSTRCNRMLNLFQLSIPSLSDQLTSSCIVWMNILKLWRIMRFQSRLQEMTVKGKVQRQGRVTLVEVHKKQANEHKWQRKH